MANGGGIFDDAVSGLGSLGATMQKGIVPSASDAAVKACVSASCQNLMPDQLAACIAACAAKVQALAQKTPTTPSGGGGVATTSKAPYTAADATMYKPGFHLNQKTIAIAVGGIAAAAFVYLYAKKKGKMS